MAWEQALLVRVRVLLSWRRHVWVRYMRGMRVGRVRCAKCGVTAYENSPEGEGKRPGEASELPEGCEDTRRFMEVLDVMES